MSEPVLSVRHLVKRFRGLTAVDDVSFDVAPGEVIALIGDNGAGKSTLIKCVSGVYQPDCGEIWLSGKPQFFSSPIAARDEGIETIYQDLALAPNLDLPANRLLGREAKRQYLDGFIAALDEKKMLSEGRARLGSPDCRFPNLTPPIESLSRGQRQAVVIARAIFWNAKLVIMDEPTDALGVPEQHKMIEMIGKLRDQGVPVVLITSPMSDVFAVSDRLIAMHRGRKVAEKRTADTTASELVQYMAGALDDFPRLEA